MGLVAVFRARVSSHGSGRLIIYVPKNVRLRLKKLYEEKAEVIVHVYVED